MIVIIFFLTVHKTVVSNTVEKRLEKVFFLSFSLEKSTNFVKMKKGAVITCKSVV